MHNNESVVLVGTMHSDRPSRASLSVPGIPFFVSSRPSNKGPLHVFLFKLMNYQLARKQPSVFHILGASLFRKRSEGYVMIHSPGRIQRGFILADKIAASTAVG